jgi:ABC-2 type transport system ATP-binding protein
MSAIEVDRLIVRYGDVVAVRGLSFAAEAGQVTCVLGRNGAGKTSTLEALEGLRRPASGRLSVMGLDPVGEQASLAPRIGVMLQEVGIHPAVRVGEAMRHTAALFPTPLDPAIVLERVGLEGLEPRTFRQLSGGEQRRLALGLALVGRPQVAFLDEPTSGVDPAGRHVIRRLVADLRADGVTVLLSTHELDEAERVADRVVIIEKGELRADAPLDELTRAGGPPELRFRAPAGLDTAALAQHLGDAVTTPVAELSPGEYHVAATPTPALIAGVTAWLADRDLPLADLQTGRRSLEDVFLDLTSPERGG